MITRNAIAIVEDDPAVRAALTVFLRALGFDSMSYKSAEAFIEESSTQDFVCILMDHNLSGMSGLQLSEYLSTRGISIPRVLITGQDDPSVREKCKELGIRLLIKPLDAATLKIAIRAAIAVRSPKL